MHPMKAQDDFRPGLREDAGGSVTRWISSLKQGDQAAASGLWDSYFRRLVGLARARLRDVPRLIADEEDVALTRVRQLLSARPGWPFPPPPRP